MPTYPGVGFEISDRPVRRVVTRGSSRTNGRFASAKMGRTIDWESLNEYAFLVRAELDPCVSAIFAQPVKMLLRTDEGERAHFPDFAVVFECRLELHEVKADDEADAPDFRRVAEVAARHAATRGALYSVARESALKRAPEFGNLKTILRRLHDRVGAPTRLAVLDQLRRDGPLTLAELARRTALWGGTVERALALAARGAIRLRVSERVTSSSLAWAPESFPDAARILPLNVPRAVLTSCAST